jgi:release factor glutamine methyltransferase
MNIAEALSIGSETLTAASVPAPKREASLLLRHVLKCDASFIYAHPDHRLNAMESILFKAVVKRRAAHEPYQYIVGSQEFFGLDFVVTPDVLIPRPETEVLVEDVIAEYKSEEPFRFCEVGVGSGCIAVSLLVNLPQASAVGVDLSEAALAVARRNADLHGVADRLQLLRSDIFEEFDASERFDLVVSNPPYVPQGDLESLQQEVRSFEPHVALTAGTDGLDVVRRLVADTPKLLRSHGLLFVEIGWDQSERVHALFDPELWAEVQFLKDLQEIPRIVKARLK